jgi:hypothetical protein
VSLTIELADVMLPERLTIDYRQDGLPLTAGLYECFRANGKAGDDALSVYLHLLWSYRRQKTNRVWANNSYLQKGLDIGERRLEYAKALLCRMRLITKVHSRDAKGRMTKGKAYLQLNIVLNPGASISAETADMDSETVHFRNSRVRGPDGTKCLKKKVNKRVEQPSAESKPAASPSPAKSKGPRTPHGRLRALFSELYTKSTRATRAPFNAACAGQLRNDLARLGEERLARCLRWLFQHPPARMKSFAYMSVHTFLPEAEKALQAEDRRLSMVRVCAGCGKEQEHTGVDCLFCGVPLKGAQHVG